MVQDKSMKTFKKFIILFFAVIVILPLNGVFAQESAATTTPESLVSAPVVAPQVYPGTDVPQILPRSTWDNSPDLTSLLTWMPQNQSFPSDWQPVDRIVIHHSATPSNDTVSAIARIQSIYRFQAVTNGWGDIGYNYIIDQDGKIYEGRYGGNGVRGAHVFRDADKDNFNYGTIGIVLLGTYTDQDASPQMYDSAERLVGWLAAVNGFEPSATKTSYIWNQNTQGFTDTFTGYQVVGHKNIESTACPGVVDLAEIRNAASVFAKTYQNYVYSAVGSSNASQIYDIDSGHPKTYVSLSAYQSSGGTSTQSVSINRTQLDLFSDSRFFKFSDGALIKTASSPMVYYVESGKRRAFQISADQFVKLGFSFSNVKVITSDDMGLYPDGYPVRYAADGALFKNSADSKIYYGQNGKKHYIGSATVFNFLGLSWSKVKTISSADADSYLTGDSMFYPDGALVKSDQSAIVYLLMGKQLHQILSPGIFETLGLNWKNIKTLPQAEVAGIPAGGVAKHGEGTLLKPAENSNVYVIKNADKLLIKTAAEFIAAGYKWSDIKILSLADMNTLYSDAAAPEENSGNSGDSSGTNNSSSGPLVRVKIAEALANADVVINASGSYQQCDANNNCQNKSGETHIPYSTSAYAKFVPSGNSILQVSSYTDWNWNNTANYNQFRGNIEIKYSSKSQKLFIVNVLPLEDYLKGIGEVTNSDEYGHIKTLIVAARTYAYNYIQQGGKFGPDEVYYLDNTPGCQLYKGYGREALAPNVVAAVNETRGEIITYNGQPIVAAYSSGAPETHDTGTRSACSVWGGKYCQAGFEYLSGGVVDPDNAPYTQTACGSSNHCVGLSAAGSREFAEMGKDYKYVLTYYYKGTVVSKAY
jgi:peptidoglycan hydrolase-like amidase